MVAIVSLLSIVAVSFLITKIASIALMHTGLSRDSARFQARSALTGCGFTTAESEVVVNHPVRRRILMMLMLVGNVGIVTVLSSAIVTFVSFGNSEHVLVRAATLGIGLAIIWILSSSRWIDKRLIQLINYMLTRFTDLDVQDYASLLRLSGDYIVTEMQVQPGDWLVGSTLEQLRLADEGLLVLGINRPNGLYEGTPHGSARIEEFDTIIIYGRSASIERLDNRPSGAEGDADRLDAVEAHRRFVAESIREYNGNNK